MGSLLKVISSGSMLGLIDSIIDLLVGNVIGVYFWGLCNIFFILVDMFEILYEKFAGISPISLNGAEISQDPVLYMINTNVVQEMIFSILTLSMILLIIFTILAIVKNMYADKPKPPSEIINASVKGLLMYLLVPVATVVCLLVGNVILRAIDGATRLGGGNDMSDTLFIAAAYNANKLRTGADWSKEAVLKVMFINGALIPNELKSNNPEYHSYIAKMKKHGIDPKKWGDQNVQITDWEDLAMTIDEAFLDEIIGGSKYTHVTVMYYYNIMQINMLTIWVGGVFMIWALGKITWGLLSRIFKMTLFYAISPALMAMYPLDNGQIVGKWRGEMVKNGTMAYCAIGTINVIYSILPAFGQIKIFGVNFLLNSLTTLLINIVALTSAEKMISTISGWFGTGDALAEGKATSAAVKKPVQATAKKATGVFAGIMAGRKIGMEKYGDNKLHGFKSMFGAGAKERWKNSMKIAGEMTLGGMSQSSLAKNYLEQQKNWQESTKGAQELRKNLHTKNMAGDDRQAYLMDEKGEYILDANGRRQIDPKHTMAEVYEGRQKVAEENKKLEELLPSYYAETDPIKKEILLNKIKSTSSVAAEKIKKDEERVQTMDTKIQSKKESVSSFERVSAAAAKTESIAKRIFGRDATIADMGALETGNLDGYSDAVKERYGQFAEMFNTANLEFHESMDSLIDLAQTDDATKEMMDNMGITLENLHNLSETAGGGKISLNGKRIFESFDDSLKVQTDEIQEMKNDLKKLKKEIKNSIPVYAQQSVDGEVDSKTYGDIGRSKK